MAQYCFFISALLYSKFSEILVILRNFFEGSRKEDDEKSEALNVSSSSLFAKLGMFRPGFVYCLEFLKKYMEILIFFTWIKWKIIWKKWEEVWSCFQAATSAYNCQASLVFVRLLMVDFHLNQSISLLPLETFLFFFKSFHLNFRSYKTVRTDFLLCFIHFIN